MVGRSLKQSKINHCSPEEDSLTSTLFNRFKLVVADSGDELALGAVQNTYPTLDVRICKS